MKEIAGIDIRPTSDMVKESVFNIIQFDIEGRRVLDLFAGTGQLGIEALSRGAKSVVFIDSSPEAVGLIHKNVNLSGFEGCATIYRRDALRFLEGCEAFDLIFIDPPYDTRLADRALEKIIEFDKLNANGIIICETRADNNTPTVSPPYVFQKEYIYGSTKILRLTREPRTDL